MQYTIIVGVNSQDICSNVVGQDDPLKKKVHKLGPDVNDGISWKIVLYDSWLINTPKWGISIKTHGRDMKLHFQAWRETGNISKRHNEEILLLLWCFNHKCFCCFIYPILRYNKNWFFHTLVVNYMTKGTVG